MKTKYFLTTALILGVSAISFSQTKQTEFKSESNSELKKATRVKASQSSRSAINNADGYMGRKKKIEKSLKSGVIPASFPKYKEGSSGELYGLEIKKWAKANKNLLTEEFIQKQKAKKNK